MMNEYPAQRRERENLASFWDNYEHLCSLQSTVPLALVKSQLSNATLDINADKLKSCDWDPLLNSLRVCKNMVNVTFRSFYQPSDDDADIKNSKYFLQKLKKQPSIRNKERTAKLCRTLRDCLSISTSLSKLEIQGIPLTEKELACLAKGLRANKTLKTLSLDSCLISDVGLSIICKDIRSSSNLNRVNFSSCKLTSAGAEILATLIKYQAMKRHNEAWKDSLRYGRPDLDSMFGIRRITINCNPLIGDKGTEFLADAFKGDLWLKALDLQDCGITTVGANHLLEGLKFNAMMHVLDVRLNPKIDRDTLQKIMEQVMINSSGKDTEYEWMTLVTSQQQAKLQKDSLSTANKIKKRRTTNASFSKKTQFNQVSNALKLKRCKSTGSVLCNKSLDASQNNQNNNNGIPWRTAARANRYRNRHQNDDDDDDVNNEDNDDLEEIDGDNERDDVVNNATDYLTFTSSTNNNYNVNKNMTNGNNSNENQKTNSHYQMDKNDFATNLDKMKSLTVKDLLQVLQREQDSKTQLEYLVLELQHENGKLKTQVNVLQGKLENMSANNGLNGASSRHDQSKSNLNKSVLDDDKALEIIEFTLHKYQKFLDFLKNAGLGKLITMAEFETGGDNTFNQGDESTLSLYQDVNQTANSFDLTNQLLNQSNFLKRFNSTNNGKDHKRHQHNHHHQQQQQHDTSNIDTLVTKSLEISRSYRRLNSSINQNNQNGNNHVANETNANTNQKKASNGSNSIGSMSSGGCGGSSSSSSSAKMLLSNESKSSKSKSKNHSKQPQQLEQQNDTLVTDLKEPNKSENQKYIMQESRHIVTSSSSSSSSSSSLLSINSNKLLYNQVKDLDRQSALQPPAPHQQPQQQSNGKKPSLKSNKNVIEELSEIMSESVDMDDDRKRDFEREDERDNTNTRGERTTVDEDVAEEEEEDSDEDYEDYTEDEDSDENPNDDVDNIDLALEKFNFNNQFKNKLKNYKHESTKAYDDDDDVQEEEAGVTMQSNII